MAQILERLPAGSRIAVIRLRSLGDCVLTTPALTLLKSCRPDLQIGVVVEDRFREVFDGNPDIKQILPPLRSAISAWNPAMVLNLHGGTRSMGLTMSSGAKIRAGFGHHAYSFLYSDKIPRAQDILGEERPVHTAEHIASAMFWMGVPRKEIPRASLVASASDRTEDHAVIHPFASAPEKAWPVDRFVRVAKYLRDTSGLEPIILAGPADDPGPFVGFQVLRNASLSKVINVLSGAQLFVGNDSGPAHMAAAFGVPVVVLFGPSDPVTWGPWRTEAQVITASESIQKISIEDVVHATEALRVKA